MFELISETEYRETMENTVEPQLAAIREELSMPLEDGGVLHAELYEQQSATRAVIVLHGYTESGEKFREMTWYFLQSGFNVYAIDHRGHGKSARSVEETWLTHVDHFSDYVNDLEAFMDHEKPAALPVCAFDGRRSRRNDAATASQALCARSFDRAHDCAVERAVPVVDGRGHCEVHVRHRQNKRDGVYRQAVRPKKRDVRGFFRHKPRAF